MPHDRPVQRMAVRGIGAVAAVAVAAGLVLSGGPARGRMERHRGQRFDRAVTAPHDPQIDAARDRLVDAGVVTVTNDRHRGAHALEARLREQRRELAADELDLR